MQTLQRNNESRTSPEAHNRNWLLQSYKMSRIEWFNHLNAAVFLWFMFVQPNLTIAITSLAIQGTFLYLRSKHGKT